MATACWEIILLIIPDHVLFKENLQEPVSNVWEPASEHFVLKVGV